MLPTSRLNETHFGNPQYQSLYRQALATPRRRQAHGDRPRDAEDRLRPGGYIIPLFPPVIDGYAPNVHGVVKADTGASFNLGDFEHMWLP